MEGEGYDEEHEALVQAYLQDVHYTGRYQSIFNIVYAMINAGLLCLPYTASQSGVLVYSFAIVFIGAVSAYSAIIVIQMATDHKLRTLEDLGERAFGYKGYYIISGFQLVFSLSLMCISLSVYADMFSDIFTNYYTNNYKAGTRLPYILCNQQGQVLLGGLFVLVLCCATRSLVSLRLTSYFTALAVTASIVAVAGCLISDTYIDSTPEVSLEVIRPGPLWWVFSFIIPFCFSFNQKALTVYSCLRRRTANRWKFSVIRAMSLVIVIYLLFGNVGYIAQKILNRPIEVLNFFLMDNIVGGKVFIDVIRSLVALSLLLTVPVDCLVASTTLKRFYRRYMRNRSYQKRNIYDTKLSGSETNQPTYQYAPVVSNINSANTYNRVDSYLTDNTYDSTSTMKRSSGGFFSSISSFFSSIVPSEGTSNNENTKNDNKNNANSTYYSNVDKKESYAGWDFDPDELVKPYLSSRDHSNSNSNSNNRSVGGQSSDSNRRSLIDNSIIISDVNADIKAKSMAASVSSNNSLNGSDIRDSGQLFDFLDKKASKSDLSSLAAYKLPACGQDTTQNPMNNCSSYDNNNNNNNKNNENNNNYYYNNNNNTNITNNTDAASSRNYNGPTQIASPPPKSSKMAPNIVLGNSAELNRVESISSTISDGTLNDFYSNRSQTHEKVFNNGNNNRSSSYSNAKSSIHGNSRASSRGNKNGSINDDDDNNDDDDDDDDEDDNNDDHEYEVNQRLILKYDENGNADNYASESGDNENEQNLSNRDSFYSNYSVYGPSVAPRDSKHINSRLKGFQNQPDEGDDNAKLTCCNSSLSAYDLIPGLILWSITVLFCMMGRSWLPIACAIGTIANAILMYILPSMLYFRVGVISDFQAIPIWGVIPNRAMMFLVQVLGLLLLFSNIGIVLYCLVNRETIFRDHDPGSRV